MKLFDNYEISPCKRYEEPDSPGTFYFELCAPAEADVWTLYGHIHGEGAQAIGDFSTCEHAEEVYFRITGLPFGGSYEAKAHLRVMHAGQKLLTACDLVQRAHAGDGVPMAEAVDACLLAIAEATGRAA